MVFTKYVARVQGFRASQDNHITVNKSRIGLGLLQLPFEYAVISYDKDIPAIKFTEGTSGDGFKVGKNTHYYYLSAKSFTKLNLIPLGLYERTDNKDEYIFILKTSAPGEASATKELKELS